MPSITFSPGTVIPSTWLNDVNTSVFTTVPNIISGVTPVALAVAATTATTASSVTNGVYTVGPQTIAGVKTFSSSPVVPTPTNATDAANKTYVDTTVSGYTQKAWQTNTSTTSGTFVDFTSFPSWVRRVTVSLNGVSTNGTSGLKVQLYASGVLTTSGYTCETSYIASSVSTNQFTDRIFDMGSAAAMQAFGNITILNPSGNSWVSSGMVARFGEAGPANQISGGGVTLSSILTGLRLSSSNGTDTFDAGSVNVLLEG